MTALVFVGIAAVVAIAIVWSRVGLARSERRSMQSYEHALHVLGDVSRRSDAAAPIHPVSPERASQGHIRAETRDDPGTPEPQATPPPPAAERPVVGPPSAPAPPTERPPQRALPFERPKLSEAPVHFEDDSDAFDRAREEDEAASVVAPVAGGDAVPADGRGPVSPRVERRTRRQASSRPARSKSALRTAGEKASAIGERVSVPSGARMLSVGAAVVVVAGLVVAGVELTSGGSGHHRAAGASGQAARHVTGTSVGKPAPTTTTSPPMVVPVSTSSTDVSFVAPKGRYSILLTDTGGECWVGIQQTAGGPYVWQETLYSGQSATYKASGPLVVRIGAPRFLGVKVNGVPARLPGFVQPYDLTFNPASQPSSA